MNRMNKCDAMGKFAAAYQDLDILGFVEAL